MFWCHLATVMPLTKSNQGSAFDFPCEKIFNHKNINTRQNSDGCQLIHSNQLKHIIPASDLCCERISTTSKWGSKKLIRMNRMNKTIWQINPICDIFCFQMTVSRWNKNNEKDCSWAISFCKDNAQIRSKPSWLSIHVIRGECSVLYED